MKEEELIGFEALYDSMQLCKKRVMWKDSVASFYHNHIRELLRLESELKNGTYTQRKPNFFEIREPKYRVIMSIAFRDRIVQRSLDENLIKPKLSKMLIYDNYACQVGKGTNKARDRLKCFMQRHYRKHGTNGFILKGDVEGYYLNMIHATVEQTLLMTFDEDYKHLKYTMDNFQGDIGYNPGSPIIQDVGLLMLNDMDHMIKHELKIKGYGRCMDDFVLIHENKEYLKTCKKKIEEHLSTINMKLNTKKTKICSLTNGILYLGFFFRLTDTGKVVVTINPKTVKHERKKLRRMVNLVKAGKLTKERVDEHYRSWRQSMSYGNTYKVLKRMDKYYKDLYGGVYEN